MVSQSKNPLLMNTHMHSHMHAQMDGKPENIMLPAPSTHAEYWNWWADQPQTWRQQSGQLPVSQHPTTDRWRCRWTVDTSSQCRVASNVPSCPPRHVAGSTATVDSSWGGHRRTLSANSKLHTEYHLNSLTVSLNGLDCNRLKCLVAFCFTSDYLINNY